MNGKNGLGSGSAKKWPDLMWLWSKPGYFWNREQIWKKCGGSFWFCVWLMLLPIRDTLLHSDNYLCSHCSQVKMMRNSTFVTRKLPITASSQQEQERAFSIQQFLPKVSDCKYHYLIFDRKQLLSASKWANCHYFSRLPKEGELHVSHNSTVCHITNHSNI